MHRLTLADIIRMNQLVRGRIDYDSFRSWYESVGPDHQQELANRLLICAHEAGLNAALFDEAVEASGLPNDHALVEIVQRFCTNRWARRGELLEVCDWVENLDDADRAVVFRLFVFMFGVAEGRVYGRETPESCNHWWHRDLLDERVVRDLLSDPNWRRTAMRNDERIKGTAEPAVERDRR